MSPVADRIAAAEVRALDAHRSVSRNAQKLADELDNITDVGYRVPVEIHDEDSAVIMLETAGEQHKKVASRG